MSWNRICRLALVIGLIAILFAAPGRTRAQSAQIYYDFRTSNQGFSAFTYTGDPGFYGVYTGSAWETNCTQPAAFNDNKYQTVVSIDKEIDPTDITAFTVHYDSSAPAFEYFHVIFGDTYPAYTAATQYDYNFTGYAASGDVGDTGVTFTGMRAIHLQINLDTRADMCSPYYGRFLWLILNPDTSVPTPPAASSYAKCPTQNDNGILPGSWTFTPPVTADPSGVGLALNGSVIQKNFSLSRFHEYSMQLRYKLSTPGPPEAFTFAFGKSLSIQLTTTTDDTEDTVNFPASSYEPNTSAAGADVYVLAIGAIAPPLSPHLVITYFCLTDETAGAVTGNGTGGAPAASCKDCVYNATGDLIADVLGVLKWIWCGLSQLWDCTIKSLFYGIWKFVGVIITALAFLRQWAGLIFEHGSSWLGAVVPILWNFIRGLAGNIILTAFNALAGVFNALGITGIINAILAFLDNIPGAISQFLSFVPGVVSLISTIWDFISYWVTTVWSLVSGILGAIPVVFASVVDGFNQSAASIPVYAPTCNSSNTLFFGPCLGMYIIDNTVFDGPMYYVFPLMLGFIALNTILWSIEKFKEALSGA